MLTGVHTIDVATYEKAIDMVCLAGGNLLVIGQSGIGKTEIPEQRAALHGLDVVYWNLSTQEAPDLVGLQLIKVENGVEVVRYASPEYMPVYERYPKPVLVVVDELDKCKSDLQNPLLEIYHSVQRGLGGSLNGRKLNIRGIISTGNLPDEGAFSKPINLALTNRCRTYRLESSFEAWRSWAARSGINPLVIAFLERHQELLSMKPVIGDPTAYTRGSPRAWTDAARDLDKLSALVAEGKITFDSADDLIAHQTIIVAGRVGETAATQFRVWLQYRSKVEPLVAKLVDRGEIPSNEEMDRMELAESIVYFITSTQAIILAAKDKVGPDGKVVKLSHDEKKKEVHRVAHNVSQMLKRIPPEHQIAAIKSTLDSDFVKGWELTKCADLMKVYMTVRKTSKD